MYYIYNTILSSLPSTTDTHTTFPLFLIKVPPKTGELEYGFCKTSTWPLLIEQRIITITDTSIKAVANWQSE